MKAVYIKEFGGVENLEVRDVEPPTAPTGSEVLVRVHASALNRADLLQRKGLYPAPAGYPERIPGLEFAGEVVECGRDVKRFAKSARVFGITAGGAQAEFIVMHEELLAPIPDNLDYIAAASVPEAFMTAHDAVFTQCAIKKGETLLIHAVGSGVGLAALQLAKANGISAFGTSRSPGKLVRCSEFGIDAGLVVGEDQQFAIAVQGVTEGKGVDVILDLVGAKYFTENLHSLNLKGRLILVGLTGGAKAEFELGVALSKRLQIIGTVLRSRSFKEKAAVTKSFIEDVLPHLASGTVCANVDRVFPIVEIAAAHEYLESNESFGKVVIEM